MRRVLIVDDEPIIVQGLLSVLGGSGLDLDLYAAGSGAEALKLLSQTRMDIVISDMAMPGMDGLELMGHIHQDWPECQVIFLSGHSEFDMIYRAIHGEAVTFLLKTEGFDRIIAALKDTMEKLDQVQHNRETEEKLLAQQEVTRKLFQREALTALVQGRSRRIRADSLEIDIDAPILPVYAYTESNTLSLSLEELHEQLLHMDRILRMQLSMYPIRIAFWNHHEDILWLLQPGEGLDMQHCMLYARESMELIQTAIERETGITLAFALTTTAISSWELAEAYQVLRRRICQGMGVPGMIALQSPLRVTDGTALLNETMVSRLREAMEHMQQRDFLGTLKEATDGLRRAREKDDPYAMEAFLTLSRMFLSYINRWKLHDSVTFPGGLSGLTSVAGFASWDEAADAFLALGENLQQISEGDEGSRSQAMVMQIRDHINRHLSQPDELSLSRIAEITFFNPAYLSRLFHQVTGETLSDYISHARTEKANEMLRDARNRIGDIAEAVGFSSSANFSRFYRRMMGCTPQTYRETLAKNSLQE